MVSNFEPIARYFWDCDSSTLHWEQQRNFKIRRILQYGDKHSLDWLRSQMSDEGLRKWIVTHAGNGLNPRQIRYGALILGIESSLANEWVKRAANSNWERRG
jgi:hypothetical protein